jgi:hypothetical protein
MFIAAVISGMMAAPSTLLIGQPRARNSYSPDLLFGCDSALWLLQLKALKDSLGYGVVAEAVVNAQLEAVAGELPRGATVHMVVLGLHGAGPELTGWFTVEGCQVHDADVALSKHFAGESHFWGADGRASACQLCALHVCRVEDRGAAHSLCVTGAPEPGP